MPDICVVARKLSGLRKVEVKTTRQDSEFRTMDSSQREKGVAKKWGFFLHAPPELLNGSLTFMKGMGTTTVEPKPTTLHKRTQSKLYWIYFSNVVLFNCLMFGSIGLIMCVSHCLQGKNVLIEAK